MTLAPRQPSPERVAQALAERRELARRENILRGLGVVHLRCAFVADGDSFAALGTKPLARWEQIADLRNQAEGSRQADAQIIRVPGITRPADIPAGVLQRGVEVYAPSFGKLADASGLNAAAVAKLILEADLDVGDFAELVPAHNPVASGHSSYAHENKTYSDAFAYSSVPLSGNAAWTYTGVGGTEPWSANGSALVTRFSGNNYDTYYINTFTPGSADYSVELLCDPDDTAGAHKDIGPAGRLIDVNTGYYIRFSSDVANNLTLEKRDALGGGSATLGTATAAVAQALVRIELVGSTIKAYYDGSQTEVLSVSDGAITATNSPGMRGRIEPGAGTTTAHGDDFAVYESTGGYQAAALVGSVGERGIGGIIQ